jgi:hypothetical protein
MLVEVKETVKEMKKTENDSLNTTPSQPLKKFKKLIEYNMMLESDENSRKQLVIILNKYLFQSNGVTSFILINCRKRCSIYWEGLLLTKTLKEDCVEYLPINWRQNVGKIYGNSNYRPLF